MTNSGMGENQIPMDGLNWKQRLEEKDAKIQELENKLESTRKQWHEALNEQVEKMFNQQQDLREVAREMAEALRNIERDHIEPDKVFAQATIALSKYNEVVK